MEGEIGREKHQCVIASQAPIIGDFGLQPRHVPRLEIKPATLWFSGQALNPQSHTSQG